jgi:hypothetical protein
MCVISLRVHIVIRLGELDRFHLTSPCNYSRNGAAL